MLDTSFLSEYYKVDDQPQVRLRGFSKIEVIPNLRVLFLSFVSISTHKHLTMKSSFEKFSQYQLDAKGELVVKAGDAVNPFEWPYAKF